ncbi:MAG: hypothetical protein ACFFC7_29670 [Candidatus Hermodarchaeota archaeon]
MGKYKLFFPIIFAVIIVFIAVLSFFGNLAQSDYSGQINTKKGEVTGKQTELERMIEKQMIILNEDISTVLSGGELTAAARDLAYEYVVRYSTIGAALRASLLRRIVEYLNFRLWLFQGSWIGRIKWNFSITSNEFYEIADKEKNGFDFKINKTEWEASGLGNAVNLDLFLIGKNFPATIIDDIVNHPNAPQAQVGMQIKQFNKFLQSKVIDPEQSKLNELKTEIEVLESSINQIAFDVALLTLASVLSLFGIRIVSTSSAEAETKGEPALMKVITFFVLGSVLLLIACPLSLILSIFFPP